MSRDAGNHATTDRVTEHAHETIDRIAETAGKGEEKIRQGAAATEARIRETSQHARERSEDLIDAVTEFVRDNPKTSIGLAFVAGTLLSILTRRH
jgi:ElaB/YqjD/DUF883 family membrane-anchored ribosome-binding protein